MDVHDSLARIGDGHFQRMLIIACGVCFMSDSVEVTMLSFLSFTLDEVWDLDYWQTASMTSAVFAGMLIGSLIWGALSDLHGRRPVFLASSAVIAASGTLSAFAINVYAMMFCRFFVGVGVGGFTIPFDIAAEFLPVATRGRSLLLLDFFWTAGSISIPIIASMTLPLGNWRLFVFCSAIPSFAAIFMGYKYVPESPLWLVEVGNMKEADVVIKSAAMMNGKTSDEADALSVRQREPNDETEIIEPVLSHDVPLTLRGTATNYIICLGKLTQPDVRNQMAVLCALWCVFGFSYYGLILATTRVFREDEFSYKSIMITCSAEIIGTFLALRVIDNPSWGRVYPQMVFYLAASPCAFFMCNWLSLSTLFGFLARMLVFASLCLTWVSTPEILPTDIRGTGHSIANACARIGAFTSPYIVHNMNVEIGTVGVYLGISCLLASWASSNLKETVGERLDFEGKEQGPQESVNNFQKYLKNLSPPPSPVNSSHKSQVEGKSKGSPEMEMGFVKVSSPNRRIDPKGYRPPSFAESIDPNV
ncbi:hypothetical protein TrVE_jg14065 [Triparma verrucosa]|uniref:Major facilitator superfamily (MFS) profile domain-containing protein n=1 Tax=Triparma verrucosa TaxID=1606542 RepID=A0A9W7F0R3_9STRA|nr:hypothetical protein TrVE_jg14065 [Triparma verrucosa]